VEAASRLYKKGLSTPIGHPDLVPSFLARYSPRNARLGDDKLRRFAVGVSWRANLVGSKTAPIREPSEQAIENRAVLIALY
jgi:hypothetical protein